MNSLKLQLGTCVCENFKISEMLFQQFDNDIATRENSLHKHNLFPSVNTESNDKLVFMEKRSFEEMDEYNEIVFYLLAWLAFWLIIEIKILFTCGMRIYLNDETLKKKSRVWGKLPFFLSVMSLDLWRAARRRKHSASPIKVDYDFIIGNLYPSPGLNEF